MANSLAESAQLRFDPVGIEWRPEALSQRLRFGLLALATDHASETELHRMLPAEHADLFVTRVRHGGQCDIASLRAMGEELVDAVDLLLPGTPLDGIAYGCTSGTVAIGYERVAAAIRSRRPGVAVTTPISAADAALRALDVDRVAVLTPYVDEVNEMVAGDLAARGFVVSSLASFGLETDIQMSSVLPETIERAVLGMDTRAAGAVFICCTALRSVTAIEPLERRLGLPVISSNQAMLWEMLQAAGYPGRIDGYGGLFTRPGGHAAAG